MPLDVSDELIGDLMQCQVGDFEFVLGDQGQQQVEGPFEVAYLDRETFGWGSRLRVDRVRLSLVPSVCGNRHRARTSRARRR